MNLTANIRQVDSIVILDISGRIVLGEETAALRSLLNDLLSKGHNKIIFNLGEVEYIDTAGLGFLISGLGSVRKLGGELKLPPPKPKRGCPRSLREPHANDSRKGHSLPG